MKLLHVLLRKAGKKVSSVEGNEEYMNFFLLSSRLQHRVLVHFFQVLLTWQNPLKLNTFFCSLQCVEKVTAQMIPSSSPFKFWHGSLFVTVTNDSVHVRSRALAHAPFGLFHFRWKVEMRKWLVNNTSVYFFSSPGLLEHDFVKKTAREKRWSARVSRLKCTRSPRPVDRGRPQCPVSYPDNNNASRLFVGCGGPKLTGGASGRGVFRGKGHLWRVKKKKKGNMGITILPPRRFWFLILFSFCLPTVQLHFTPILNFK